MKKKLLALLVPFCCLGFSVAYAQTNDEPVTDVSKEVSVSEDVDQVPDNAAPPSFYKKGCGCGK